MKRRVKFLCRYAELKAHFAKDADLPAMCRHPGDWMNLWLYQYLTKYIDADNAAAQPAGMTGSPDYGPLGRCIDERMDDCAFGCDSPDNAVLADGRVTVKDWSYWGDLTWKRYLGARCDPSEFDP